MSDIIYTCKNPKCNNEIPNTRKFCGRSCQAIYGNSIRTSESKEKRSISFSKTLSFKKESLKIEYEKSPKFCKECNTQIPYEKRGNIFCNGSCSAKDWNKNIIYASEESKNKRMEGIMKSVPLKRNNFGTSKGSYYFNKTENKEVYLGSTWEIQIAEYLDLKNIEWIRPKPLTYFLIRERFYFSDFFLPKFNVYLDPKNQYCITLHLEKIEAVLTRNDIKLYYGDVMYLKNIIDNLVEL